jgi:hypothetical protein
MITFGSTMIEVAGEKCKINHNVYASINMIHMTESRSITREGHVRGMKCR